VIPSNERSEQFGRPANAAVTTAINAGLETPNTGSVWPTRDGSDWAALDSRRSLMGATCSHSVVHGTVVYASMISPDAPCVIQRKRSSRAPEARARLMKVRRLSWLRRVRSPSVLQSA
jgi:hypothetical protein